MNKLIVFFGAIGDTILLSPAIQKLSENGIISAVGYPERMALLEQVGWLQKVYDADIVDFTSIFSTPSKRLCNFLIQFDTVYFFFQDGESLIQKTKVIGVPNTYYFPGKPPNNWKMHASTYYLQCFGFSPIRNFTLPISPKKKHNEVIIHPGSGSKDKNYPIDLFLEITELLLNNHFKVRWCLGPAEEKLSVPHGIPILQIKPLTQLAEYIAGASVYIGNDSGISHLAGALGVKTITLFYSTDPKIWAPLGLRVFTFTRETLCLKEIFRIIDAEN
ncbi:MAG: glycosyltransferase family 9 protein [Candidatus Hydrogenedens sp.]